MLLRRVEEQAQPGEEPGTWVEDFALQPIIVEEIQHSEDWDPETHGDIPVGKGSPPEAFFRRMAEKGKGKGGGRSSRPKGKGKDVEEEERSEEEEGEGKKGGKKGRSVGTSHGDQGGAVGLTSSSSNSQTLLHGKGSGKGLYDFPQGCGRKGDGKHPPIYVTEYGTKFHTQPSCSSLAKSRLTPSSWCTRCMKENEDAGSRDWAIVGGPGEEAHVDSICPLVTGRRVFRKCGLCQGLERLR